MHKASNLAWLIAASLNAHAKSKRGKPVRRFDKKTPYGVHPTWCSLTILTEPLLPEIVREIGSVVLAFHDVLEETGTRIPGNQNGRVLELIEGMTFNDSTQEMMLIWERGAKEPLLLLFKLYDKVSNLMDGTWMDASKRATYCAYTMRLAREVANIYGEGLNIIKFALAMCGATSLRETEVYT